jgi:hypothetical protein
LKRIKLFEDFSLDKFLENPDSQFHDDSNPDIVEGDWVNSYRGPGQFISISGDMAKVQLISGSQQIVTVPIGALSKITKAEATEASRNLPNTKKELSEILSQVKEYAEISISEDNLGNEEFTGNSKNASKYMEEILVDLIDLKNKDPYVPYYKDYGNIISIISLLCDLILDIIDDPALKNRIEFMQEKYYEISV